jgi:hypothetical protein
MDAIRKKMQSLKAENMELTERSSLFIFYVKKYSSNPEAQQFRIKMCLHVLLGHHCTVDPKVKEKTQIFVKIILSTTC